MTPCNGASSVLCAPSQRFSTFMQLSANIMSNNRIVGLVLPLGNPGSVSALVSFVKIKS